MGLLSKLFGNDGKNAEKAAKDFFEGLFQQQNQNSSNSGESQPQNAGQQSWRDQAPVEDRKPAGPSGDSWGEEMPAEENQFNFNGTYTQYFEGIFRSEFASYRIEKETAGGSKRVIFTFFDGERKALVVEIMPSSSESKKLRSDCREQGIPYLRYYYDHEGWWNTRSYVVRRTSEALKG